MKANEGKSECLIVVKNDDLKRLDVFSRKITASHGSREGRQKLANSARSLPPATMSVIIVFLLA